MNKFTFTLCSLLGVCIFHQPLQAAEIPNTSTDGLERVTQQLVAPPFLPEHSQIAVGAPLRLCRLE